MMMVQVPVVRGNTGEIEQIGSTRPQIHPQHKLLHAPLLPILLECAGIVRSSGDVGDRCLTPWRISRCTNNDSIEWYEFESVMACAREIGVATALMSVRACDTRGHVAPAVCPQADDFALRVDVCVRGSAARITMCAMSGGSCPSCWLRACACSRCVCAVCVLRVRACVCTRRLTSRGLSSLMSSPRRLCVFYTPRVDQAQSPSHLKQVVQLIMSRGGAATRRRDLHGHGVSHWAAQGGGTWR